MNIKCVLNLILIVNTVICFSQQKTLRRSDSFWGIHFDRHVNENDKNIGKSLTEAMIDSLLLMAKPDYIQVDSKGHPGISSYPTRIGKQAKSYEKDPLLLLRRVTTKHNVALFAHYSGVMDIDFTKTHPEESRISVDGMPGPYASLWGNYADKLLIPQLKELAIDYRLDGVWIDGEAWAVHPDYCKKAEAEFENSYSAKLPRAGSDPLYKKMLEFNRKKFLEYIKKYTTEVHKVAPDFQICSNWAFSALCPDPIPANIGLDFLSGDYDPDNALNTANFHARCLQGRGMPFDLMAWGFVRYVTPKTAIQLCQEAASVISLGGGCQVYLRQNSDLSFPVPSFKILEQVGRFMNERRTFCKDVTVLPQIAMLYSTEGWKSQVDGVYQAVGFDSMRGVLNALLDGGHSVEVLYTDNMKKRMYEFPVIVVPEWKTLEIDIVLALKEYVKKGGRLIVIGVHSSKYFDTDLGVDEIATRKIRSFIGFDNRFTVVEGVSRIVRPVNNNTKIFAKCYDEIDFRFPASVPVSTLNPFGKGYISGIYTDVGSTYLSSTSPVIRDLLAALLCEMKFEPIVKISNTHKINVVPTMKEGRLLIQLVNTSGDHANTNVKGIDEIPSLRNLDLNILTNQRPANIKLQPGNEEIKWEYRNNRVFLQVKEIDIHRVIEVRFK